MRKITKTLLILLCCLGLTAFISLAVSSKCAADPPAEEEANKKYMSQQIVADEPEIQVSETPNSKTDNVADNLKNKASESPNPETYKKGIDENSNKSNIGNKSPAIPTHNEKDNNDGIYIYIALNFLLTIWSYIALRIGLKNTNKRVLDIKDVVKVDKQNFDSEIQALKKRILQLESETEKIPKLEKKIEELQQVLRSVLLRGLSNVVDSNKSATNSLPEGNVQRQTKNENSAPHDNNITFTSAFKKKFNFNWNSEIGKVISAFNEMMDGIANSTNWEGKTIRENFANKYQVVAFRCVNTEQRVNHPEIPPMFEVSTLLDSKLWGVPISDGTLIVFPNPILRDYESSLHYRGGMRELFDSGYTNGNYRKITVTSPAIITRDLKSIKMKGTLELSQN